MARIRSIKPEFWTSEQVVELSPIARLLFIGLWNFCDDAGIHPASSRTLKMEVFPGDDFTTSQIDQMISELLNAKLLAEFTAKDGKMYWFVTGWGTHQKVEKPNFKHPQPTNFDDHSTTIRRPFDDHSTPEGKGREGNRKGIGKEGSGKNARTQEEPQNFQSAPCPGEDTPPANFYFEKNFPSEAPSPQDQLSGAELPADDEYTRCYQAIVAWGKMDNWATLRKISDDARFIGNVQTEVVRFITHNLAKDNYRVKLTSNPVKFLREQLPGWLRLPAAGRNTPRNAQNSPRNQKQPSSHPTTPDEARKLIQVKFSAICEKFTEGQIQRLANAPNESTFHEWAEGMAKRIYSGQYSTHQRTGTSNTFEIDPSTIKNLTINTLQ